MPVDRSAGFRSKTNIGYARQKLPEAHAKGTTTVVYGWLQKLGLRASETLLADLAHHAFFAMRRTRAHRTSTRPSHVRITQSKRSRLLAKRLFPRETNLPKLLGVATGSVFTQRCPTPPSLQQRVACQQKLPTRKAAMRFADKRHLHCSISRQRARQLEAHVSNHIVVRRRQTKRARNPTHVIRILRSLRAFHP